MRRSASAAGEATDKGPPNRFGGPPSFSGSLSVFARGCRSAVHREPEGAQKAATFRRPPVTVFPASEGVGSALVRMALRICAAVEPG